MYGPNCSLIPLFSIIKEQCFTLLFTNIYSFILTLTNNNKIHFQTHDTFYSLSTAPLLQIFFFYLNLQVIKGKDVPLRPNESQYPKPKPNTNTVNTISKLLRLKTLNERCTAEGKPGKEICEKP